MVPRTRMGAPGMERQGHTPDTYGRWSLEDLLTGMGYKRRGGLCVWGVRKGKKRVSIY